MVSRPALLHGQGHMEENEVLWANSQLRPTEGGVRLTQCGTEDAQSVTELCEIISRCGFKL